MASQRAISALREVSILLIAMAFYIQAWSMWTRKSKAVNPLAFMTYALGSLLLIIELYLIKDPVYTIEIFGLVGVLAVLYLYYY